MVSEIFITLQGYITVVLFLIAGFSWYKLKATGKVEGIKIKRIIDILILLVFPLLIKVLTIIPADLRDFLASGLTALILLYLMATVLRQYRTSVAGVKPLKIGIKHEALMPQVKKLEALKKKVDKELTEGRKKIKQKEEELEDLK